jgi:hypothetical protein
MPKSREMCIIPIAFVLLSRRPPPNIESPTIFAVSGISLQSSTTRIGQTAVSNRNDYFIFNEGRERRKGDP